MKKMLRSSSVALALRAAAGFGFKTSGLVAALLCMGMVMWGGVAQAQATVFSDDFGTNTSATYAVYANVHAADVVASQGAVFNQAHTNGALTNWQGSTADHQTAFFGDAKTTLFSLQTDHFRSKAPGNWNTIATWESSSDGINWFDATLTPDNNANTITIVNGRNVTVTVSVSVDQVTVDAGGQITVNSGQTLTVEDGTGTDLTVNGVLSTAGTVTNNGTTTINGIFQINEGGFGNGTADFTYGTSSTLVISYTQAGTYGPVDAGHRYFPTTNGPTNLTLQQTGAGVYQMGKTCSIAGTLRIQGTGTKSFDLQGFGFTAGALAVSSNLTMLGSSALTITGDVSITGGTLALSSTSGGDLKVGGNWSRFTTAAFAPNERTVFFNGTGTQLLIVIGIGTERFNYLVVQNAASLRLSTSTDIEVNRLNGLTLGSSGSPNIDINGHTMTLSAGGNLDLLGAARSINSSAAGGTFAINTATTTVTNGGSLSFDSKVTVSLSNGFNPGAGLTTINGTLEIKSGGFVSSNAPTYGSSSTLIYNSGTNPYNREVEWNDDDNSNPGRPHHVIVKNNTTLNYPNGAPVARFMSGDLTVEAGSSFYMDYGSPDPTNPLSVAGSVTINGNLSLSGAIGGDIKVGGNWVDAGTFNANGRSVTFNGTGNQSVSKTGGNTFAYLIINKASGTVNMSNDVTVNGTAGNTLQLLSGTITTGANTLTVSWDNINAISRTSGYVIGNLARGIANGTSINPYEFPVGTAKGYTPSQIMLTNAAGSGSQISVKSNDGTHPDFLNYGLDTQTKYVNRWWDVTSTNLTMISANAQFTFLTAADPTGDRVGGVSDVELKIAKYDGGTWTYPTNSPGSNLFSAIGLTSFSSFMAGACGTPTVTASSNSPVCVGNDLNLSSTPSGASPFTYSWEGPNSFTSSDEDPTIVAATAAATGTYMVTATDAAGCEAITTTAVTVVTATGPIWYVNAAAASGGNGGSWACAFQNVQDAIDAAGSGDEIWVAAGTYLPTKDPFGDASPADPRDKTFYLKDGVKLYGGFLGTESMLSARDWAANVTTLSGDIDGGGPNDCSHVVLSVNDGAATELDGFTVTGGSNDGNGITVEGYFISPGLGGGMHSNHSSPTISNCTFTANTCPTGAGLYTRSSASIITNCTFSANIGGDGGGIHNLNASSLMTISNCTFSGNTGGGYGAGLTNVSSSPTITNCAFTSNIGGSPGGGGMANVSGASPIITQCTFTGNSANSGGGMYNDLSSSPTLTNCLFSGNTGGGNRGGGIINDRSSSPILFNCSFSGNSSLFDGGAISSQNSSSPTATNCIFWGNSTEIFDDGGTTTVTYSIVQGGFTGTGNLDADPLFVSQPTFAGAPTTAGDLHITACSPAVNTGTNTGAPTNDLYGNARPFGTTVDMGVHELQSSSTLLPRVYVDESAAANGDGTSWLTAVQTLQEGLDLVCPGGEIWVADGTYYPSAYPTGCTDCTGDDRNFTFYIPSGVKVYGGFDGGEGSVAARPSPLALSLLSGDLGTSPETSDNAYHVVLMLDASSATVLDGFTIAEGNADGGGFIAVGAKSIEQAHGGGLYNDGAGAISNPTIANCTFFYNSAFYNGAGMFNNGAFGQANPTLTDCTFDSNNAGLNGGGMDNNAFEGESSPSLTRCKFFYNYAPYGGGVFNNTNGVGSVSSPNFTDCSFESNTADHGGAMYNNGDNSGTSSPTITRCIFNGNIGYFTAGAMYNNGNGGGGPGTSSPSIVNCVFMGNTAIDVANAPDGNGSGGAVRNDAGNGGTSAPSLTNCTFYGNSADYGAAMNNADPGATPTITNCIFWDNTTVNGPNPSSYTIILNDSDATGTISYSIIEGGIPDDMMDGGNNLNTDPLFRDVSNPFGGDGMWATSDDGLVIGACSPAVDAGTDGGGAPATDILGNARVDGDGMNGMETDMGAYESQAPPTPPTPSPSPVSVCLGGMITVDGNPGVGIYVTHAWTDLFTGTSSGFTLVGEDQQTLTIDASAATAGTINLHYEVTDNNGCTGSADVTVTVLAASAPTLGTYSPTTVATAGGNTTASPSAMPANTDRTTAHTSSTDFKGVLNVDPVTGVVSITDAHPAGAYAVTVTAYNCGAAVATSTFTLTVGDAGCSEGLFSGNTQLGTGPVVNSVAIGDFNNDGNQDFAAANASSNNVSIRLGDGAGGFSGSTQVSTGNNTSSVAIGDFDSDGNQDFVATNQLGNTVSIRLGDGAGNFSGSAEISVGAGPSSIAVGDFNGDGKHDFATTNQNQISQNVSIRLGDGAGGFSGSTELSTGSTPYSVAIGDFNEDGDQDLAVANINASTVSICLGDGLGGFNISTTVGVELTPGSVAIGDFDGDGHQDLAVANVNSHTVSIRLGDGTGNFSGSTNVGVGERPNGVAIGDFNGDGDQDFATAGYTPGTVSVRLGDGAGNFSGSTEVTVGTNPVSVAIGDFNNDGLQDFAAANQGSNNVSIRLGGASEINVQGNSADITDGNATPDAGHHTDFGTGTDSRTFTIQNTGSVPLNISSITVMGDDAGDFSILGAPSSVAALSSAMFTVNFTPTAAGLRTTTVHIANDDCSDSEADYDFAVQATAVAAAALDFDGVDDYVIVSPPNTTVPNVFPLTIEAWVKPTGSGGEIVDRYIASSGNGYRLYLNGTTLGAWYFTPGGAGGDVQADASIACIANQWNHVAMTVTPTELNFYVNGTPAGKLSPSGGVNFGQVTTTTPITIGRFSSQTSNYFQGQIDDVRIWGEARSCEQISQLRNCEMTDSEANLVAYYKFNQGFAAANNAGVTTLTDAATAPGQGGANDGTLHGFALTGTASNWVAPGGVVTGTSCPPVVVPDIDVQGGSPLVSITDGDATPSATDHTNFGTVSTGGNIVRSFTIKNTGNDDLTVTGITKTGGTGPGDYVVGGITLPATISGSGGFTTFTVTFTPSADGDRTTTLHIASNDCDEADYDFAVTGGRAGAALDFDGVDNYVSLNGTFGGPTWEELTVEAWVKVNAVSGDFQSIVSAPDRSFVHFQLNSVGQSIAYTNTPAGPSAVAFPIVSPTPTGQWRHLAMVIKSGDSRFYVDGIQQGPTVTSTFDNILASSAVTIGRGFENGRWLNGQVDEVRIWSAARTCDEIYQLRNCELTGSEDNLVAYYQFNQGVAAGSNLTETTLFDAAGSNDGTLNGFTLNGPTSNWVTPGGVTTNTNCTAVSVPSVSIAADPGTAICAGTNIDFTATPVNGGTPSYQWKVNGSPVGTNSPMYSSAALADGDVVTCEMTSSTSSCVVISNSLTMAVTAQPTTAAAGLNQTICFHAAATLAANTPGIGTRAWSVFSGPDLSSTQFSSTSDPEAIFTPTAPGTYVLRWTISNAPCTPSTSDVTITVTLVTAMITAQTNVGCSGDATGSATVTATGGTEPYTYLWNDGAAQTMATATGLTDGTYTATVTDDNGCVFTTADPQDYTAYWPLDGNFKDVSGNGHHANQIGALSFVAAQRETGVSFTPGNYFDLPNLNLATGTISAWVYINAHHTQKIFRGPNDMVCFGEHVGNWEACGPISATPVVLGTWHHIAIVEGVSGFYLDGDFVPMASPLSATANEITHVGGPQFNEWLDGLADEIKWYGRTLTPAEISDLASGNSSTAIITAANPRPTGVLSGTTTICGGGSATLSIAVTGTGPFSGTLSPGDVPFSGAGPAITVMVSPGSTETYTIATLSDDNCASIAADLTGSAEVTVNDVSPGFILNSDATLCTGGDPSALTSSVASGVGTLTYQWQSSTTSCSADFANILGETDLTYDPPALTQTTYYRLVAISTVAGPHVCQAPGNCLTLTVVADPTAPVLNVATPTSGTTVCTGASVNATITPGSGGTGTCTDTYEFSTDNGGTWAAYTSGNPITAGTMTVKIRVKRDCDGLGCDGAAESFTEIASWPVVADPTAPSLNTPTPANGSTVCMGASVSATITPGSGGTGTCTDTYEFSTDNGGTWAAYTSGAAITAGSMTVKIRVKRDCNGVGCDGAAEAFAEIASWLVVAQPTGPTLLAKNPDLTEICTGQGVDASFNSGSGGAGCTDDFVVIIDGGAPVVYIPTTTVGAGATMSIVIQGRRANCAAGAGCTGTSYTTLASWTVNAQPTAPTLLAKTPNVGTICTGLDVSATFNTGTGGTVECVDDFVVIIDGGSPAAYTPGSTVGASATSSIVIQGRRDCGLCRNCPGGGTGCLGTEYETLATWTVVADPTAPILNTATPSSGTFVCEGTTVSATITPGSGGAGSNCGDVYEFSTDNGSTWAAYTSGDPITAGAMTVRIRVKRECDGLGCDGAAETFAEIANWPIGQEINVLGNGVTITDGDNSPSLSDHTDFGSTAPSVPIVRTFTVQNLGGQPLNVTSVIKNGVSDFTINALSLLDAPIPAGGSATFTATFNSATLGIQTATISIANDDCGGGAETTYTFDITAEVGCAFPVVSGCPGPQIANTASGICTASVSYDPPVVVGTPTPTLTYAFTGATSSSGSETGSGSNFNKGVTTVTLTATNACGASSCMFTVTVTDNQGPTITCPSNIIRNTDLNLCTAVVNYANPTTSDNCSGLTLTLTGGLASGSAFPKGVNNVNWTVTDGAGREAVCNFTVTVLDAQLPTITCPSNIVRSNNAGQCYAVVTYAMPMASDNCGAPTVMRTSAANTASGSQFPAGVTTSVTWQASDNAMPSPNVKSCTFTVKVNDTQLPTITCPANQTKNTDPSACTAVATYIMPPFTDNCTSGGMVTLMSGLASGQPFPKGITTLTLKATDAAGNSKTCTFRITVNDNQAPSMTCPSNIALNTAPDLCTAVATYTNPSFTDNCPPSPGTAIRVSGLASGSAFPAGTSNVVFRATDAAGLTKQCTMTVTVTDIQPPTITCPPSTTVTGSGSPCVAQVNYATPTAVDNCSGTLTPFLLSGLSSGSTFPAGVTTNTWRAAASNNQSTNCSFTVTVSCGAAPNGKGVGSQTLISAAEQALSSKATIRNSAASLELFPNPTDGTFNLLLQGFEQPALATIFDATGRQVWQQRIGSETLTNETLTSETLTSAEPTQVTVDLSDARFSAGLYMVTVASDGKVLSRRLVLTR